MGSAIATSLSEFKQELDVLCIVAHPDDAEIGAGGTLALLSRAGYRTGILNFTRGEMGTRGSAELRRQEALKAAAILGITFLGILDLGDCRFQVTPENITALIQYIRHLRPKIVIANALSDRHPDHGRAATLVRQACFYAGLRRWETTFEGQTQAPHRPLTCLHMLQDHYHHPTIVVDITSTFMIKMEAIKAYASQFYNPNSNEPETPISRPDFLDFIEARAREMGRRIFVTFGEGFVCKEPIPIKAIEMLMKLYS